MDKRFPDTSLFSQDGGIGGSDEAEPPLLVSLDRNGDLNGALTLDLERDFPQILSDQIY